MEEAVAILDQTIFSGNSIDISVRNLMSAKASEGPEAIAAFLGKYWLAMLKELLSQKETLAILAQVTSWFGVIDSRVVVTAITSDIRQRM